MKSRLGHVISITLIYMDPDLTREMVDLAIFTNNDMIIVPAGCQAIHPPSRKSGFFTADRHQLQVAL